MTILSCQTIRRFGIVTPCHERTRHEASGMTYGLSGAGYDLTIKDQLYLAPQRDVLYGQKSFSIAVAQEQFLMPRNVLGRVCDKSSLARRGIQVFNTVIEPGWCGFLTLEIANHSDESVMLLAGQPIAQVIFELLDEETEQPYVGRYQNQPAEPVPTRLLTGEERQI